MKQDTDSPEGKQIPDQWGAEQPNKKQPGPLCLIPWPILAGSALTKFPVLAALLRPFRTAFVPPSHALKSCYESATARKAGKSLELEMKL